MSVLRLFVYDSRRWRFSPYQAIAGVVSLFFQELHISWTLFYRISRAQINTTHCDNHVLIEQIGNKDTNVCLNLFGYCSYIFLVIIHLSTIVSNSDYSYIGPCVTLRYVAAAG